MSAKPKTTTGEKANPAATTIIPAAVAVPAATTATTGTPDTPRSSTAELTNILERIDKFLAEDTPSSANPTVGDNAAPTKKSESGTEVMSAAPVSEKSPANDTTKAIVHSDDSDDSDEDNSDADLEDADKSDVAADNKPAAGKDNDTSTVPSQRKTQPMWARPDVMDEDLAVEEPRKTTGSSDTTPDDSANDDDPKDKDKKTGDDQQRLF